MRDAFVRSNAIAYTARTDVTHSSATVRSCRLYYLYSSVTGHTHTHARHSLMYTPRRSEGTGDTRGDRTAVGLNVHILNTDLLYNSV